MSSNKRNSDEVNWWIAGPILAFCTLMLIFGIVNSGFIIGAVVAIAWLLPGSMLYLAIKAIWQKIRPKTEFNMKQPQLQSEPNIGGALIRAKGDLIPEAEKPHDEGRKSMGEVTSCPNGHSTIKYVPIVRGLFEMTPERIEEEKNYEVYYGGCLVVSDEPDYMIVCTTCGARTGEDALIWYDKDGRMIR
ncbi:hypothetical protein ACFLU3_00740 [Chloroflexota bacterium]